MRSGAKHDKVLEKSSQLERGTSEKSAQKIEVLGAGGNLSARLESSG